MIENARKHDADELLAQANFVKLQGEITLPLLRPLVDLVQLAADERLEFLDKVMQLQASERLFHTDANGTPLLKGSPRRT